MSKRAGGATRVCRPGRPEWIGDHKALVGWLATLSSLTLVGTLIAIPLLVARIPEDYFVRRRRRRLSW